MTDNSGPKIGAVLGKYRITRQIGRGGMATIFAAENVDIGKAVAVKVLSRDLVDSKTVTERFLREARAAAKLTSPHICEVYDVGTVDERPFIVMELLQGESLYDRLARERRLPLADVISITTQVGKGLSKAHSQQIVHRDLKPENIFLTVTEDGQPVAKLVDFGLAKFYEPHQDPSSARLTKEGALFGTPAYMSPEQAKAKNNVDQRSDLWALGCIVYEMLTGRTVWDVEQGVAMILAQVANGVAPDPRKYRPDLPQAFSDWFKRALARNVDERFQSADELTLQLRAALSDETAIDRDTLGNVYEGTADENGRGRESSDIEFIAPSATAPPPKPPPPLLEPSSNAPAIVAARPSRRARWWWSLPVLAIVAGAAWFALTELAPGSSAQAEVGAAGEPVGRAQQQLLAGDSEGARATLQSAFDKHQHKATRSILSHITAASEVKGPCKLLAVGHPRPFDTSKEASKPSLVESERGVLAVWAAADGSSGRTTAYSAWLDESLRRTSEPLELTPGAALVREPELVHVGEGSGLIYWDFAGEHPGVYAAVLDATGRVQDKPQLLSSELKGHPYYPSVAAAPDGGFIAVYVDSTRERVHDLMARRLNGRLEPEGEPVAITGYATPRNGKIQAARPSVAFFAGLLHIAYTVRRPAGQELLLMRLPAAAIAAGKGVQPAKSDSAPTGENEEMDRFLGQVTELSVGEGKFDFATLLCSQAGCYAAWDKTLSAAELVFIDKDGKVAWRRQLANPADRSAPARPGIALSANGVVAAWFQDDRVLVADVSASNPILPSAVGRAAGVLQQPQPLLFPTNRSNEFLVTWRGYEAAVPEPFVARVRCP